MRYERVHRPVMLFKHAYVCSVQGASVVFMAVRRIRAFRKKILQDRRKSVRKVGLLASSVKINKSRRRAKNNRILNFNQKTYCVSTDRSVSMRTCWKNLKNSTTVHGKRLWKRVIVLDLEHEIENHIMTPACRWSYAKILYRILVSKPTSSFHITLGGYCPLPWPFRFLFSPIKFYWIYP